MARFDGKTALVTGSTQGLGRTLLVNMATDGLAGAVVTGRDAERGGAVVNELGVLGCDAAFVPADLGSADAVQSLLDAADDRFGRIDCLANCGAITDRGDVWTTTADFWDSMMAVNVRAPFLLTQGVARIARRNQLPASVVNVGSVAGYGGPEFITAYSVSKGALMTMTKSLAFQLMRHHVRVVTVNPGWMDTPGEDAIQRKYHDGGDDWLERAEADRPFGRLIKPDELARTLAFVLSDEAGMMTGSIIDYDQTVLGAGNWPLPPPIDEPVP
ncbi:MAG: SDR family oxidoreductase [Ilumatobacter sp.]|uniref:SDR family oxidoreductase n=1 Tax=Ilumatobacter sp. TaxID=1967498 RepID=UPI00260AFB16|nr:SDR family oxidoreductase [Ilumatobacter sp.]MDJ0770193.1 SDR family oxidoreductase [Ilumatobacter sp.]